MVLYGEVTLQMACSYLWFKNMYGCPTFKLQHEDSCLMDAKTILNKYKQIRLYK